MSTADRSRRPRLNAFRGVFVIVFVGFFLYPLLQNLQWFQVSRLETQILAKYAGRQYNLTSSTPYKNISLAQFSSSAKHLIIARAVTPAWHNEIWWGNSNGAKVPFLAIHGCQVPDFEDVDILILDKAPGHDLLSTLDLSEIETNMDVQEVRIVDVYHAADTRERSFSVPDTDGLLQMRMLLTWEAGFYSHRAYDAEYRGMFHLFGTSQYSAVVADPRSHVAYYPYGFNLRLWFDPPAVDFAAKRNATTLFVQRNCKTPLNREQFIQALMKHMDIDCPGQCLHNFNDAELPRREAGPYVPATLYSQYKFAIVIENQLCRGYVSEKLPAALASGSIPIVMSHRDPETGEQIPNIDDYAPSDETHSPTDSYIDLARFSSAKEAADFLLNVATNETMYNSYLWPRFLPDEKKQEVIANMEKRAISKALKHAGGLGRACSLASKIQHHDGVTRLKPLPLNECVNEKAWTWPELNPVARYPPGTRPNSSSTYRTTYGVQVLNCAAPILLLVWMYVTH